MNPDIKAQWLQALRSGEYQQGKGFLRRIDNSYCCLGVLCDLAVKAEIIRTPLLKASGAMYGYGDGGSAAGLPDVVRDWAGLKSRLPVAGQRELHDLNDRAGFSFAQIADLIEEYL